MVRTYGRRERTRKASALNAGGEGATGETSKCIRWKAVCRRACLRTYAKLEKRETFLERCNILSINSLGNQVLHPPKRLRRTSYKYSAERCEIENKRMMQYKLDTPGDNIQSWKHTCAARGSAAPKSTLHAAKPTHTTKSNVRRKWLRCAQSTLRGA